MKNEIEPKKEYSAPKMDVVEVKHQLNLLQCSDPDSIQCYRGEAG